MRSRAGDGLFAVRGGATWFTADLHLGHERIIELCARPFGSLGEMHDALIDNWNSRVEDRDTVWVLGDVALGPIEESLALVSRLNGHKILVAGNHDRCFAGYNTGSKLAEWVSRYQAAGFRSVVTGRAIARSGLPIWHPLRAQRNGTLAASVVLSHFPRSGESRLDREDRFAAYRPRPHRGRGAKPWVLHGHVHNGWTLYEQQINVGVDVWDFAPVHAETLIDLIERGLPPCQCTGTEHMSGAPGCAINGGPATD
jgi:calcineurin-like phosphoesterase family protein